MFILFTSIHGALCIAFGIVGSTTLAQPLSSSTAAMPIIEPQNMAKENINIKNAEEKHSDEEETPVEDLLDETPLIGRVRRHLEAAEHSVSPDETSAIIPKTPEQRHILKREEQRHMARAVLLGFATAGLVSWNQFLGKIAADLFYESFHGVNQFDSYRPWFVLMALCLMLAAELYLMSEIMRIFDAVLIIPIYNSLQILSTIALSGVYWDNFRAWSAWDSSIFTLGLCLIFGGIAAVSHGQKHQSMAHHEVDKRSYLGHGEPGGVEECIVDGKERLNVQGDLDSGIESGDIEIEDVAKEDMPELNVPGKARVTL